MQPILQLDKICKSYNCKSGSKKVLHQMNMQVFEKEIFAITGRSGSGKSTLLNIMAATLTADSGAMYYKGQNMQEASNKERASYRRDVISYIPQGLYLLEDRDVFNNIALPLQYGKKDKAEIRENVQEIAAQLCISQLLHKSISTLSGGEKQRVAICRALVKKPEILFADEPTGSLDLVNEEVVLEMFLRLREQGTTIIVATHDDTVLSICDKELSLN